MPLYQYQPTHEARSRLTRLFGPKTCFWQLFNLNQGALCIG